MKGPGAGGGGLMEGGVEVGSPLFHTVYLPAPVTDVPREVVRAFSHNKRVGMYLLGRSLGEGSFAKVKEALHLPTGEKVAMKVIDKKRAKADPYVRKNLRREGRLLQQVRHPHVIQLLEVLETEHSYYMVTECCQGGDLMDYIAKRKKLEEKEVKKFIRQIVSAVDYLHRLGIIHRDLKIENLLLDHRGDIKIIDFGLSNTVKVSTAPEGTAHAQEYLVTQCGSPAYAAPELLNHRKYGLQVDVWSIGVNMYAMLTGMLPFTVEPFNIKALYNKMMAGHMNPIPDSLSKEGKDILKRFLTADPEKRLTIKEALSHPWLADGRKPLERHPFPNKLKTSDLDIDILKHMSENLGFRMSEVIRFVVGNVPSSACATYHMFHRKLQRHRAEQRLKGKAPAVEGKHVEATRISLVLQDMTPRVTNPGGHAGKTPRTRRDSLEKEVPPSRDTPSGRDVSVHLARRQSLERGRLGVGPVATEESIVVRERTFLSSRDHSMDDLLCEKENSERSFSKHTLPSPPGTGNSSPGHNPRITSPGKVTYKSWGHHQGGLNPSPLRHTQQMMLTAPNGTSNSHCKHRIPSTEAAVAASVDGHRCLQCSPPGVHASEGRRGRVLVPLAKTLSPARRVAVARAQANGHIPTGNGPEKSIGIRVGSPRVDGAHILRATYPAPSTPGTPTAPPSTPGFVNHTPIKRHGQWQATSRNHVEIHRVQGHYKVKVNTGQNEIRISPGQRDAKVTTGQHDAKDITGQHEIKVSSNQHEVKLSQGQQRLKATGGQEVKDAHSKRPVSPQVAPLVRRRLVKRSRHDTLHPPDQQGMTLGDGETDNTTDHSVTVERLVSSPEQRTGSRTVTGQSGQTPQSHDSHTLPVLPAGSKH